MTDDVSLTTRYVLVAAGAGFICSVLFVAYWLVSAVASFARLLLSSASKSKVTAKKQQSVQQATPQVTSHARARELDTKVRGPDLKSLIKDSEHAKKKNVPKEDIAAAHELWVNTLKGHTDAVHGVAWSADGRSLATACEDMYLRVFDMSDIANRDPKFRRVKTAKTPLGVGFGDSPTQLACAMRGVPDTHLAMYELGSGGALPQGAGEAKWMMDGVHGKEPCLAMLTVPGAAALGGQGLVFCCSTKKEAKLYDTQGCELAVLQPASLANHTLVVSADGRFVAVPSFTSDLKIWELKYDRERVFRGVSKAMDLKGHTGQIMSAAFRPDNKRAVSASKDLTLRVWNIDVRYGLSEDPKTTLIIPMPLPHQRVYQHMAFGAHGIIAASYEGQVHFLAAASGELLERIDAHDAPITSMSWSPAPLRVPGAAEPVYVLATSSRDKRVRLWRSP